MKPKNSRSEKISEPAAETPPSRRKTAAPASGPREKAPAKKRKGASHATPARASKERRLVEASEEPKGQRPPSAPPEPPAAPAIVTTPKPSPVVAAQGASEVARASIPQGAAESSARNRPSKSGIGKSPESKTSPVTAVTVASEKARGARKRAIGESAAGLGVSLAKAGALPAPVSIAPGERSEAVPKQASKSAPAHASATAPKGPSKGPLKIPPILLEGDSPALPPATGGIQKYALGPGPPGERPGPSLGEGVLPATYGTGRFTVTPRDPHWLYAHWDLSDEQQLHYNKLSADHHLVVLVHLDSTAVPPVTEVHVHPESRHWFIHVERAGATYVAELGYYTSKRRWVTVATAAPATTPRDSVSEDQRVQFATFGGGAAMAAVAIPQAIQNIEPYEPLQAHLTIQTPAHPALRAHVLPPPGDWTPAQERALVELLSLEQTRQQWAGSESIIELISQRAQRELRLGAMGAGHDISSPAGGEEASVSSPLGGEQEQRKGFWFNINAELVIYGATEADARVTIGGRPIRLRPDGSFSYRFALPDGHYELAVTASSAGGDSRQAGLKFHRRTAYEGQVEAHPQDPRLKIPAGDNVE